MSKRFIRLISVMLTAIVVSLCIPAEAYAADVINPYPYAAQFAAKPYVAMKSLPSYKVIKKSATDAQMAQAYNILGQLMVPMTNYSKPEQLMLVSEMLRGMVDCGLVQYSQSYPHYNDPYGYLVNGVASCAGSTRTTIMALEMLGITGIEHVHANQYCHQWARVRMDDGTYWICDPFGLYVGPEPAPYVHPYAQ